jgi:hypothetical protein
MALSIESSSVTEAPSPAVPNLPLHLVGVAPVAATSTTGGVCGGEERRGEVERKPSQGVDEEASKAGSSGGVGGDDETPLTLPPRTGDTAPMLLSMTSLVTGSGVSWDVPDRLRLITGKGIAYHV